MPFAHFLKEIQMILQPIFQKHIRLLSAVVVSILLVSCGEKASTVDDHGHDHGRAHGDAKNVTLSPEQVENLGLKTGKLTSRNLESYVQANGQLEVPPQSEATVTATVGANVTAIKVIEGDKVKKGQVLAYLSHPDLVKLQSDYLQSWSQLNYLETEYARQKKLYEGKVSSGKEYQKLQAQYLSEKGKSKGLEAQLSLLGMRVSQVQKGEFYQQVPLTSPIEGYVRLVEVKTGQYVSPQSELFEIVNINHIHADLMVFEKDMYKVKKGQKVLFSIESLQGKELEATIYSVGKAFEQDPKAIHLHAEIEEKTGTLLPGTYVQGRILVDDSEVLAVPEEAVVREGDKHFVFTAGKHQHGDETEWNFKPIEVTAGTEDNGWVEIKSSKLKEGSTLAMNNAYHLMAELKKEEAEHSH